MLSLFREEPGCAKVPNSDAQVAQDRGHILSDARSTPDSGFRPSRRQVLQASLIGGIAVYVAPLGSQAFASLFEQQLLTRPNWNPTDGVLKYRVDGTSKVIGAKVFARDI